MGEDSCVFKCFLTAGTVAKKVAPPKGRFPVEPKSIISIIGRVSRMLLRLSAKGLTVHVDQLCKSEYALGLFPHVIQLTYNNLFGTLD